MALTPRLFEVNAEKKVHLRGYQSEDRKSFKPPFLFPGVSSRMRILLRRWTTQFLVLEGVLEEDELEPGVEEEEELEGVRERERCLLSNITNLFFLNSNRLGHVSK